MLPLKPCARGGIGRRIGLKRKNLSARRETGGAELLKVGEPCEMAIPSQARPESGREGVEARRAAPNIPDRPGDGEGIVQTPNPIAKAVGGGESRRGQENPLDRKVREGSSPSARTNFTLPSLRSR